MIEIYLALDNSYSYWWFLHKDETGLYNLWINFSDLFNNIALDNKIQNTDIDEIW